MMARVRYVKAANYNVVFLYSFYLQTTKENVFESWHFFSTLFQFDRRKQYFSGVEEEFQP